MPALATCSHILWNGGRRRKAIARSWGARTLRLGVRRIGQYLVDHEPRIRVFFELYVWGVSMQEGGDSALRRRWEVVPG